MPKINVVIDTDNNTLTVKADSKDIANVVDLHVYNYKSYDNDENQLSCSFTVFEEDNGLNKMSRYSAVYSPEATEAAKAGRAIPSKYEGFVQVPVAASVDKLEQDIAKFMRRGV